MRQECAAACLSQKLTCKIVWPRVRARIHAVYIFDDWPISFASHLLDLLSLLGIVDGADAERSGGCCTKPTWAACDPLRVATARRLALLGRALWSARQTARTRCGNVVCAIYAKTRLFAKTGSGQTSEKERS